MSAHSDSLVASSGGFRPETYLAAAAYLVRYSGSTLAFYTVSLGLLFSWCGAPRIDPLDAQRAHLELFVRQHLKQEHGCRAATVAHLLTAVRGFYRFAVLDGVLPRDTAAALRVPRLFRDPIANDHLSAQELRAMIAAAARSPRGSDQGLIALLAIHGLRIQEALAVRTDDFAALQSGYRVLRVVGKGGRPAIMPLTVASLRMLEAAAGGRLRGPLLLLEDSSVRALVGAPLTYRAARIAIGRLAVAVGIERRLTPHMFRRGWVRAGLRGGAAAADADRGPALGPADDESIRPGRVRSRPVTGAPCPCTSIRPHATAQVRARCGRR